MNYDTDELQQKSNYYLFFSTKNILKDWHAHVQEKMFQASLGRVSDTVVLVQLNSLRNPSFFILFKHFLNYYSYIRVIIKMKEI